MTNQVVHFEGDLAKFGKRFDIAAESPADIFRLLDCQLSGFRSYLIKAFESGLDLAIVSKDSLIIEEPEELLLVNRKPTEYYISLIPTGTGWLGKILAAVLLVVVAYFAGPAGAKLLSEAVATNLYTAAALVAISGIVDLLTRPPKTEDEEKGPGIFDGPENTIKSGQPVPVLYGELLVGGAPIHVDISNQETRNKKVVNNSGISTLNNRVINYR